MKNNISKEIRKKKNNEEKRKGKEKKESSIYVRSAKYAKLACWDGLSLHFQTHNRQKVPQHHQGQIILRPLSREEIRAFTLASTPITPQEKNIPSNKRSRQYSR